MTRLVRHSFLVAAAWACSVGFASAAAFQNGGFETPQLGGGGLSFLNGTNTSVTGWTSTGSGNVLFNNGNGFAVSSEANQGIIMNDDSGGLTTMFQTFDTVASQQYQVLFDLSRENGASGNAPISVLATGGVSTPYNATPSYQTNSYSFTASSSLTTLTFSRASTEGQSPLLDNVRINAVPEPSTLALGVLAGLFALAFRRKV
jgi:Protein of unknown function (DUF642)/PEP-CTERM motif